MAKNKKEQPRLFSEPSMEYDLSPEELARKEEYQERLRVYQKDPDFRQIPGFPIGDDKAILALSVPPYYTACPNPFVDDVIQDWEHKKLNEIEGDQSFRAGEEKFDYLEPLSVDVSAGKYHPIYRLHPYPTKVPHQAVMRYILHYTSPGDIVFDGFCGTGMTGVAANLCGNKNEVQKLGLQADNDNSIKDAEGNIISHLGERNCILNDLSTSATFLSSNWNSNIDGKLFENESEKILQEVESEIQWMYQTLHNPSIKEINAAISELQRSRNLEDRNIRLGIINYTAWSDVFICPHCSNEIVFWDSAVDEEKGKVSKTFNCNQCEKDVSKSELERAWENIYDNTLEKTIRQAKRVPVLINYSIGNKRFKKKPDEFDYELLRVIESIDIPYWYPSNRMPEGDESRRNDGIGITHVHQFYSKRNLWTLASIYSRTKHKPEFLFAITRVAFQITHLYRLTYQNGTWGAGGGPLSGTLYVPSLIKELNIYLRLEEGIKNQLRTRNYLSDKTTTLITNNSSTDLRLIKSNIIDYIFVDPPFGGNLMYSELNFIWESWLKVFTNNDQEVIENNSQGKGVYQFQRLMTKCFGEFYRILKPGKWITIEFHNSKNSIWNSIQEALQISGFIIADVRTLDKKKKTFKQVVASGAVDQDLIISAYKPSSDFEKVFSIKGGTDEGAWEFVRQHLKHLPIVVTNNQMIETVAERTPYLLFDRMIAYHIQEGKTIPLSASVFYKGLKERFPERDGMLFLPDQVLQYDKTKLSIKYIEQLVLFVTDEKSTIQWLQQILDESTNGTPQTYQNIQPKFLKQLQQARHEQLPELKEILEQNFLNDEQGRWYVPDPNKASDLEKIRNKSLLREFNQYLEGKKKLKQFRTEAVRAGFAEAWQRKDFNTIIKIAERLPERVLQEDPDLLMYYDNASLRVD